MTPADLSAWRTRLGLSRRAAAAQLGIGRQTLINYERGDSPIPRYIELACRALEIEKISGG